MTLAEFIDSAASEGKPPAALPPLLAALWHAEKGDWNAAHNIAQEIHTRDGSWVHAHLHRVEGDLWNARYWYEKAGRPESKKPLSVERHEIVGTMLS